MELQYRSPKIRRVSRYSYNGCMIRRLCPDLALEVVRGIQQISTLGTEKLTKVSPPRKERRPPGCLTESTNGVAAIICANETTTFAMLAASFPGNFWSCTDGSRFLAVARIDLHKKNYQNSFVGCFLLLINNLEILPALQKTLKRINSIISSCICSVLYKH